MKVLNEDVVTKDDVFTLTTEDVVANPNAVICAEVVTAPANDDVNVLID